MIRLKLLFSTVALGVLGGCDREEPPAANPEPATPQAGPSSASAERSASESAPIVAAPVRTEDLPTPVELTDEDWPQYRGALRDGIARGATRLARSFPEAGPPVLWETAVGQGYSAPSVVAGRVYLNDYDEDNSVWMVRCLQLEDGEELWRYEVDKRIRPNHAITRSAPATDGGFVFSIDPKCELHCLDARDGSLIWKLFLPEAYDSQIPPWYNGQCPLLDEGRLVIATGGRALLVALDKATGEPIWETPNDDGYPVSHSSITPVTIDGVKQYAYTVLDGAVGVAADTGELLWRFPWKFNTAVATMPLPLGEGRFLLTSGYHAQTVICQVKRDGDDWIAEEAVVFQGPPLGWNSEVHTPIVYRDHIYGVGKSKRGLWTCIGMDGETEWDSLRKAAFGMGGYVLADGMFFVLEGKTGTLRVLDADADEYLELASATVLQGPDVWAPPVVSHGRLLIRDLGKLVCLHIAADASPRGAASGGEGLSEP